MVVQLLGQHQRLLLLPPRWRGQSSHHQPPPPFPALSIAIRIGRGGRFPLPAAVDLLIPPLNPQLNRLATPAQLLRRKTRRPRQPRPQPLASLPNLGQRLGNSPGITPPVAIQLPQRLRLHPPRVGRFLQPPVMHLQRIRQFILGQHLPIGRQNPPIPRRDRLHPLRRRQELLRVITRQPQLHPGDPPANHRQRNRNGKTDNHQPRRQAQVRARLSHRLRRSGHRLFEQQAGPVLHARRGQGQRHF